MAEALFMVEQELLVAGTGPTYPELATVGASLDDVRDAFDLSLFRAMNRPLMRTKT